YALRGIEPFQSTSVVLALPHFSGYKTLHISVEKENALALTAGTRIGPYEVKSPLGEGGMGVVFRALDTKLHREVALKLLPDHFADDPERLARFQREAQVLTSLNHPNIAQIHGLEYSTSSNNPAKPKARSPLRQKFFWNTSAR